MADSLKCGGIGPDWLRKGPDRPLKGSVFLGGSFPNVLEKSGVKVPVCEPPLRLPELGLRLHVHLHSIFLVGCIVCNVKGGSLYPHPSPLLVKSVVAPSFPSDYTYTCECLNDCRSVIELQLSPGRRVSVTRHSQHACCLSP